MKDYINVIGGGLAGCEAAYQIAKRGIKVKLYEMKPIKFSPAHTNENLAEIVCSNSFKSNLLTNACGLLKEELRMLDSLLIKCADKCKVPAGQALAVDREEFSKLVTKEIESNSNIEIIKGEVSKIPEDEITIIATGPLTSENLSNEILKLSGQEKLFFYDAQAPIVTKESIDMTKAFTADRYGKGESDYINCPMTKQEYEAFYKELVNAEKVTLHDFEKGGLFEGCMPIEEMARRGSQTLTYGPLKPVGFGKLGDVYAVVQLRQDNKEGTLYNLVGFQTNLKFGEQKRVFSMIPALHDAEFVKYGVMHRNTFINSPELLDATYNLKGTKIFFAGQISGVEGYVESIASGLVSALNAVAMFNNSNSIVFSKETIIGALADYISNEHEDFQPMNANFGLFNTEKRFKSKQEKYEFYAQRSINKIKELTNN
ncbi:MAG: methylenetetrahydrofolate--tRNA-(uracil(54)-C(5))-methyltransferase (FADH(2)-oxidizing) TrmFO [Clostridia bacterium]|nr:methylenetetrahydrofolate--tRNA-(uracil(54)-C(5))-methyltransferase (FADH(2)-oxidizing) TrmFO [Clostridia bacterium]